VGEGVFACGLSVCDGREKIDILIFLKIKPRVTMSIKKFWQKTIDANPHLTRIGQPWDKDEEQNLLNRISEGKSINEISVEFKRAKGGITSRLKMMARDMLTTGKSVMEVSKLTGISDSDLEKIGNSQKKSVKSQTKIQEINPDATAVIKHLIDHTYKDDIAELLTLTRGIHSMLKDIVGDVEPIVKPTVKAPIIIKKRVKGACLIQED
jgi:hypothetical protein